MTWWYADRTLRVGILATLFYASYLSIWTRHFTCYDAFCNKISPITNIVVVAICLEQMFWTRAAPSGCGRIRTYSCIFQLILRVTAICRGVITFQASEGHIRLDHSQYASERIFPANRAGGGE